MKPVPDIQKRQQDQYAFPYHHISHIDERGDGSRIRYLGWGFEYLIYTRRVVEVVRSLGAQSVLDVGCGDGYLLSQIPNEVPIKVGVDINRRALSFARAFSPDIDFRDTDVANVEEKFDVVCAIEVIEHIPDDDVEGFLTLISQRVKPGGHIVISVPTVNEPLNSKHFRHYDSALLKAQLAVLKPKFKITQEEFYYRKTLLERCYRRITGNIFLYGEIPILRRLVWRYVSKNAVCATESDGVHLMVVLKRDESP